MWLGRPEVNREGRRLLLAAGRCFTDAAAGLSHAQRDELRALQIAAVIELSPMILAVNAACILIVDLLSGRAASDFLMVWTGAMAFSSALWMGNQFRARNRPPRRSASLRGVRRMTWHAGLAGLIWAAPMLFLFDAVGDARARRARRRRVWRGGGRRPVSGADLAGGAGLFQLVILLPGLVVLALNGEASYVGLAALAVFYGFAIARTVAERSRLFVENFVKTTHLREQGQVISLLLKDFEESSSDWLFEVNTEGRLGNARPSCGLDGRGDGRYLRRRHHQPSRGRLRPRRDRCDLAAAAPSETGVPAQRAGLLRRSCR